MTISLEQFRPAELFTGYADEYAKSRPTYPAQAIDFILNQCNLRPGCSIADVGCGTGISARLFAERELRVFGIDPNEDMRRQATSAPGASLYPITYSHGTGEHTGLPKGSLDAVVAAQAFHWFEPKKAFKEFQRITKPEGWVVLMFNHYDERDPFTAEATAIMRTWPETQSVEQHGGAVEFYLSRTRRFSYLGVENFYHSQTLDKEGLVMRYRSNPFFPKDGAGAESCIRQFNQLFEKYSVNSEVQLCLKTPVFLGKRVESFSETLKRRFWSK